MTTPEENTSDWNKKFDDIIHCMEMTQALKKLSEVDDFYNEFPPSGTVDPSFPLYCDDCGGYLGFSKGICMDSNCQKYAFEEE